MEKANPRGVGSDEYELRPLRRDDYSKGYVPLLCQLTIADSLTEEGFAEIFAYRERLAEVYYTLVVEHLPSQKLVATGTLVIEAKFSRGGSKIGHVEDIVTDSAHRGKGLARDLLGALADKAKDIGCYKVILDCSSKNVPFYEKCGYRTCEMQMRLDIPPDNDFVVSPKSDLGA